MIFMEKRRPMCEVCAAFGRGRHWTDRAGSLPARSESVDIRSYRNERRSVLGLINEVLMPLRLFVEDWDGEAFTIHMPSGANKKVENLGELWQTVEKLNGAPVDPLSWSFLSAEQS
jgi:hypothetical protein